MNYKNYRISSFSNGVKAISTHRLSFEPKDWQITMRDELRSALKNLKLVTPDEFLVATYNSSNRTFCDVENILMYNVGVSCFRDLSGPGFVLERGFTSLSDEFDHEMKYQIVPAPYVSKRWDLIEQIGEYSFDAPRLTSDMKPADVWRWCKLGTLTSADIVDEQVPLCIKVDITPSHGQQLRPASCIKPLLDGLLCAFHAHDGSNLAILLERLSTHFQYVSPETIQQWLLNKEHSVLGQRRLLHPVKAGIQWNPADDRLVLIHINIKSPSDETTKISGTLHACNLV